MRSIVIALFCFTVLTCGQAGAATRSMCPDRVLDRGAIEGIFQGVECGDLCHMKVKLPNGEEFSLIADEELAEEAFGAGTGQKVSVTYEVQQFWRVENPDGDPNNGWCQRSEVFLAGKVLAAAPALAAEKAFPAVQVEQAAASGKTLSSTEKAPIDISGKPCSEIYSLYRLVPAGYFYQETHTMEMDMEQNLRKDFLT